MAQVIKRKPTSPGRRFVVSIVDKDLHKGAPYAPLTESKNRISGRNNRGKITVRHKGGGHKRRYRAIDFKRIKDDIPATVERIEYDPNRSANIALVLYADGERTYIIAQMARSAGTSAQLIAKEGTYVTLRLRSGEVRKVLAECRATIGEVSKKEHSLRKLGKAGATRWRGVRPTVRGVVMNPVDHPHGGGEGKTSGGRHPVSPWGTPTKGYKTRSNKRTDKLIVRRRNK